MNSWAVSIGAGTAAGLLGALIWGMLVYFTGYKIGYIAIGVGALTGFGVRMGLGGEGGFDTGMIAAIIAMISVILGEYLIIYLSIQQSGLPISIFEINVFETMSPVDYIFLCFAGVGAFKLAGVDGD